MRKAHPRLTQPHVSPALHQPRPSFPKAPPSRYKLSTSRPLSSSTHPPSPPLSGPQRTKMQHPTFLSTPVTSTALLALLLATVLTSLLSLRPHLHLQLTPHLLQDHQFSRLLLFQTAYTNSSELLFASLIIYHLRLLERAFGSRKFLSLVLYSWAVTSGVIVGLLVIVGGISQRLLGPLDSDSDGGWNYVPAGPTAILFALLANWREVIPPVYKFSIALPGGAGGGGGGGDGDPNGSSATSPAAGEVTLSDKSFTYLLSLQLFLSQTPGSAVCAAVGWVVGYLWRLEVLPGARWRVNGWVVEMVGGERGGSGVEVERIRERLREGAGEGAAQGTAGGDAEGRRSIVNRVLDTFRGS